MVTRGVMAKPGLRGHPRSEPFYHPCGATYDTSLFSISKPQRCWWRTYIHKAILSAKRTLEHFCSWHLVEVLSTVSFGLCLSEEQMENTFIELLFAQFKVSKGICHDGKIYTCISPVLWFSRSWVTVQQARLTELVYCKVKEGGPNWKIKPKNNHKSEYNYPTCQFDIFYLAQ